MVVIVIVMISSKLVIDEKITKKEEPFKKMVRQLLIELLIEEFESLKQEFDNDRLFDNIIEMLKQRL
ncbi:hypothetical protein DRP05_14965 [Archaeoglobales archaeon]|nr:MAG: hypothetical protein DRP05_14965 [Archaeoglobales archaeon]